MRGQVWEAGWSLDPRGARERLESREHRWIRTTNLNFGHARNDLRHTYGDNKAVWTGAAFVKDVRASDMRAHREDGGQEED